MDEETANKLLASIPGSKRAANGIIIEGHNDEIGSYMFHVTNIFDKKELEGLTDEESFYVSFCSKKEIIRLREIKNAHDYLLRIRAEAIADSPRAIRVMSQRKMLSEKTGQQWSLTHYYHSKDHFHKSYISHVTRANSKILKSVPSGLAFIKDANATCVRSFTGDAVIISESLEHFFYFMSIGFYGEELGIEPWDRQSAFLIAARIMNKSEALDFDIDPRGILPVSTEKKLKEMVKTQMQFTFGHEYAHYIMGHLAAPELDGQVVQQITRHSFELEFEADLYAINLMQNNNEAKEKVIQAAFSVLMYFDFIEKVMNVDLVESNTHPKSLERMWRLFDKLGKKSLVSKVANKETLDNCINFLNWAAESLKSSLNDPPGFGVILKPEDNQLTFYGSVYLPSYITKIKRDRIDF